MSGATVATPLREDLRLHESGAGRDGAPMWAIQDPVTNRFYRIGWLEYECLLRWPGDPKRIAEDVEASTPLAVDAGQVEDFARFLEQHQLVRPTDATMQRMHKQANEPGWRSWRWWLHNYLFVRVPLLRPQRFLQRLAGWLEPLFSVWTVLAVVLASLLGLVLVARQWDSFSHGVLEMLTPSGLLGFAMALVLSKTLHELGHALVATRLGVRVAHMGVAFLVLWPMLYTDTGESWRLRSHRQRLAISIAGVTTEMALAGLATLVWALLDDGALRQAMLYLATTGWVLSLALNVSPFMRFDGYFILSDLLDFPNLHERAGAMARAWLRRTLLGLDEPAPEMLPLRTQRLLVLFAFLTWLYRLVVFLGIALAVYLLFFKVLGIFLLCVELLWFVARPVWSEVSVWVKRWDEVRASRRLLVLGLPALGLLLLALPWAFEVKAPGVAHPERVQHVYAPFPAQLQVLQSGGEVVRGALLAQFSAPDLVARAERSGVSVQALRQRLGGLVAEEDGQAVQPALRERLQEQLAEVSSVRQEVGRLRVTAEFDGVWLDVDPQLRNGVWVGTREPLGVLVDPRGWVVDAYVEQRRVDDLQPGAKARFHPEGTLRSIAAEVLDVDSTRIQHLPYVMLAARHGGSIATRDGERQNAPSEALYRVRLRLNEPLPELREVRGNVYIEGPRKSLLWSGVKAAAAVLVRESGF